MQNLNDFIEVEEAVENEYFEEEEKQTHIDTATGPEMNS